MVRARGQDQTAQGELVFAETDQLDSELEMGSFFALGAGDRLVPPRFFVPEALQEPRPLPYLPVSEPRNFDTAIEASVIPAGLSSETFLTQTNDSQIYW